MSSLYLIFFFLMNSKNKATWLNPVEVNGISIVICPFYCFFIVVISVGLSTNKKHASIEVNSNSIHYRTGIIQ